MAIYASNIAALVGQNRFNSQEKALNAVRKSLQQTPKQKYHEQCKNYWNSIEDAHLTFILAFHTDGAPLVESQEELNYKLSTGEDFSIDMITATEYARNMTLPGFGIFARELIGGDPELNKEYGNVMEERQLVGYDQQIVLKKYLMPGVLISGKADAMKDGVIIEVKNRVNKFPSLQPHDKIQLMSYLWMSGCDTGILREYCKGVMRETIIEYDSDWFEGILSDLREQLNKFDKS